VGRKAESKVIDDFLHKHVSQETAGSMYVSGAPGTGKTAVLLKAIERLKVCNPDVDQTVCSDKLTASDEVQTFA
jgi:Cdc6-like AAA superfamily ATPase